MFVVESQYQVSSKAIEGFICFCLFEYALFNPLALEVDIYSLAHNLCKMWIFYEPRRVTLGNTRYFMEE